MFFLWPLRIRLFLMSNIKLNLSPKPWAAVFYKLIKLFTPKWASLQRFKARTWSAVKVATSRLTPADTHTSSTPAYPQYMESSPDSGSVLLGSTLCLFIHMLIGFYKKQWTDQSYDGTSYNPATTYPGHTLSLLLPFTPPLLSYLHFEGLVLRRVADSTVLWCLIVMEM